MPTRKPSLRIDVTEEVASYNRKTHIARLAITPSKDRYEEKEYEGKKYYLDKFDNILYPQDELLKGIAESLPTLPKYATLPTMGNFDDYVKRRSPCIKKFFKDKRFAYTPTDKSQEFQSPPVQEGILALVSGATCLGT